MELKLLWTTMLLSALTYIVTCLDTPSRRGSGHRRTADIVLCLHDNRTYHPGDKFSPDPCTHCRCTRRNGKVNCAVTDCAADPACTKYEEIEGQCCPPCLEHGCVHRDRKAYRAGPVPTSDRCERCFCPAHGGRTICNKVRCPYLKCKKYSIRRGKCCPSCDDSVV